MDSTDITLTALTVIAAAVTAGAAAVHGAATARSPRWRARAARITNRRWGQQ